MAGKRLGMAGGLRALALVLGLAVVPGDGGAQSLRGGREAMEAQNRQAIEHDFTFLRNSSHVARFVELNLLVPLQGNENYRLHGVSFPFARPAVKLFVERLSEQYQAACGQQLVVTSLTRPQSRQPPNSSELSVHPTGMAVDLRRSSSRACRAWLEDVLLHLEKAGKLEATYERRPPHYHVAVYPDQYTDYVATLEDRARTEAAEALTVVARRRAQQGVVRHEVRQGDSLWGIARDYGTTVERLKSVNQIQGSRIYAGQLLEVPMRSSSSSR